MDCERYRDGMARRVTGLLAPSEEEELSRHLADCDGCRVESGRLKKLVAVLGSIPEEDWSEAPRKVRSRGGAWMPLAAAVLVAVGVSVAAPFLGPRPRLEGDFVRAADGTWSASGASSVVEIAGHRCVCRKDTRIRLAGAKELFLEEGRLDVSGSGREFRVGTPLGPVEVLGTDFVVEVKTVKKGSIAAGVVVGVFVSSGVVSYADLRLQRGQAAVAETGKPARLVDSRSLEDRLRLVQENGRDLERKLAALEFEKSRLAADLAAAQSGKPPAAAVKLSPADRRERFRRVAKMFVRQNAPFQAEFQEGKNEVTIETDREVDSKTMTDAFMAANDLGVSVFSPAGAMVHPEFAQEVILEMLKGKDTVEAVDRPLVEAAVQQAYASMRESYEYAFEKSLAAMQAFGAALDQLNGSLPPGRMAKAYETAVYIIGSGLPGLAPLPAGASTSGPEAMAATFAEALGKGLGLEDAQAQVLRQTVAEWYPSRLREALPEKPTAKEMIQAILRSRERNAELARRLIGVLPDKKSAIEKMFSW